MTTTLDQQLARLDEIVTGLENDKLDLSAALRLFEEGVTCLRSAAGSLAEAQVRVKRLTELADGAFATEDLDEDE